MSHDNEQSIVVIDDISAGGNNVEFSFNVGNSIMCEEIRPTNSAPYWLAPFDITQEQKNAIKQYSRLEVKTS